MQEPIELILVKHWASYTAIPILIVDADGTLVYYNQSAEQILGRSFDEVGEINALDLDEIFVTSDLDGSPIPSGELPLARSLKERCACAPQDPDTRPRRHLEDDRRHRPAADRQGGRHVGALSILWETE